jgi:hypothetical protein
MIKPLLTAVLTLFFCSPVYAAKLTKGHYSGPLTLVTNACGYGASNVSAQIVKHTAEIIKVKGSTGTFTYKAKGSAYTLIQKVHPNAYLYVSLYSITPLTSHSFRYKDTINVTGPAHFKCRTIYSGIATLTQ